MYYPGAGNFAIYSGPGVAGANLKIESNGTQILDESNTELSGHLGLGYAFNVGSSAFIRLDGKFRFFESDFYETSPDSEASIAIGWNLYPVCDHS